jgi:hypothetical protein
MGLNLRFFPHPYPLGWSADVAYDRLAALEALKSMEGIEALPLVIVRRKAFPNSFSNGLTVTEQLPKDAKAVDELLSIVEEMYIQKVDNGYQNAPRGKVS